MTDALAMIGTPVQWIVVAAVAVLLFAPRLVPVIARIAGRMVGREIQRRYGIKLAASRPARRTEPVEPAVESRPAPSEPSQPLPYTLPAIDESTIEQRQRPRSAAPIWAVPTVVAGAAAVLLWLLLHGR